MLNPEKPNDPSSLPQVPSSYVESANRAIDYVVGHLGGDLRLERVAQAACFSPFHFHRVFRSLMGETLNQFIKRLRLERALTLMSHTPDLSLTEISLECGFSSSSDFSRSFKQRFGVAPSSFDLESFRDSRRKEFENLFDDVEGGPRLPRLPRGQNPDGFEATLRSLPARTVVYLRVLDPYRPDAATSACAALLAWAEQRGWADGQWLGYMWEDPEIVALKDCRYDVALEVNPNEYRRLLETGPGELELAKWGRIGRYDFPPMQVAEVAIRGGIELETRALDWLYGTWLPRSGFVPDDQPCFEAWSGRPFAHGLEHFELACQLPVREP